MMLLLIVVEEFRSVVLIRQSVNIKLTIVFLANYSLAKKKKL